ncbi:MAG: TA system VapC family ribonuclease toxin [Dermatophilaceae bacterium]
MIVVDANLLVYAYVTDFDQHSQARDWLEQELSSGPRVALPWPNLLAFVRLVSNPRLFSEPVSIATAWTQVDEWLDAEPVWVPAPGTRHPELLGRCLRTRGLRPNDVPDAHLAALCLEHGLSIATSDTGFARFDGLRWFDPLDT